MPHQKTTVDIWTVRLGIPRPLVLTPGEQARADRFHFERDRLRWSRARTALRCTLALYLARSPEDLSFTFGKHGKPSLENGVGIEFNISHSEGWAMIAVTRKVPVGIDIEEIRENLDVAKLLHRIGETQPDGTELKGTQAQLFHAWTRREARVKALGGQLMDTPFSDIRVLDIQAPDGFAASVALEGFDPDPCYRSNTVSGNSPCDCHPAA